MSPVEAILLGLIQGLTEFLPISSSAHVQIAQAALGIELLTREQLTAFIATIQLGTELAVLMYFSTDILRISSAFLRGGFKPWSSQAHESRLGWLIIFGTLPIVVLGLAFQDLIENEVRSLWVIAITLILFGLILGFADLRSKKQLQIQDLTFGRGLLFGLGQALALIPGVSRSGGTITAGLILGFTREAAARYSFLLAIPAVVASGGYQFAKTVAFLPGDLVASTLIATVVAFASGLAVIAWLMRYLSKGSFLPFVVYRVVLGTALLIALNAGWISDIQ